MKLRAFVIATSLGLSSSVMIHREGHAQPAPDRVAAENLFRQALALMQDGRYGDACPKLEASQRIDPSYGALMNLGDCYRKIGRTASAWGAYREAVDLARKYSEANRVRLAERRAASIEPELARLEIVVDGAPDTGRVEITRGGQRVDPALIGTPLPVDPGEYEIQARHPGFSDWKSKVMIASPGQVVTERITLRPAATAPVAVAPIEPTGEPAEPPGDAPEPARGGGIQAFASVTSSIGWGWAASDDIDLSYSGMGLGARLGGGAFIGDRWVLAGGLEFVVNDDPTVTAGSATGNIGLHASTFSVGAGGGYRVTPSATLTAMVTLTRIGVTAGTASDSGTGPGASLAFDWRFYEHGHFGVGLAANLSVASVEVGGTSWSTKAVGLGISGVVR